MKKLIAVMLATCVCLLTVEIGLRLFNVVPAKMARPVFYNNIYGDFEPNLSVSETLGGALKYTINTNSQGTRGRQEFSLKKPVGSLRVLCIGDSFTFGTGVDDQFTYPEVLKKYLGEKFPGLNIEVINAGVFLYDIVDEYDYYMDKGRLLGADIVVLQYYTNDLEGMTRWFFRPHNKGSAGYSWLESTLRQTAFYNFAASIRYKLGKYINLPAPSGGGADEQYNKFLVHGDKRSAEMIFQQEELLDENNFNILRDYWEMYLKVLGLFNDTVKADGSKFLYLMIPDEIQIKKYKNAYSYALIDELRNKNICHIDMLPDLRLLTKETKKQYYNSPYDFHLNKFGYTLVAQAVASAIGTVGDGPDMKFTVENKRNYRAYRSGMESVVRVAENGDMKMKSTPGVLSAKVETVNLDTECRQVSSDNMCLAYPTRHSEAEGILTLEVEYGKQISGFTLFIPRKVGLPGTGAVNVSYAADNKEYITISQYQNRDKETPDAFENVDFVEVDLPEPCKRIAVQFRVQGDADVFMKGDEKDFRQIKFIAYPAR